MSSSTPVRIPERDQQILAVGRQCSHPSCLLVDFLPFKCQHCANSFCADHFKPASHTCPKYDESKYNRVAPDCPLCNEPVPIPPGEDPNVRMERHLTMDCYVMTGRSQKASSTPKCSRPKCGKVLFAQIQCDKCHQKFCPEHRFPSSHNCSSVASRSTPVASTPSKAGSQLSATTASGMAAVKRAAASLPTKTSSASRPLQGTAPSSGVASSGSGSKPNSSISNPFSKTERFSSLTLPNAKLFDNETDSTTNIPDRCSPKLPPNSAMDFNSFIPQPLFAPA